METKTTRRLATALEALRLISDETVSATTLSMRLADRTLGSFKVLDVVQWGICGQFGDSRGFIAARTNDGQEWLIVRSEQGAQVQRALDKLRKTLGVAPSPSASVGISTRWLP